MAGIGLDQWDVRTLRTAVRKAAVDALQIHDARMLSEMIGRVNPLDPLHVAIALERITADVEFRQGFAAQMGCGAGRDAQGVLIQLLDVIGVEIHP